MNSDELNKLIAKKAAVFMQAFTTTAGREVLSELQSANRGGDLFDPDPIKMARKVGAFEIVQGIVELVEKGVSDANK